MNDTSQITSAAKPEISVCIPAYNEAAHLPGSIASVRESFTHHPEVLYELVVCDNNSTDSTSDIARSLGAKVVFEPHNQIARARNAAAASASGGWLIFLDADSHMNPALLTSTLEAIRDPQICGGGAGIEFDESHPSLLSRFVLLLWKITSHTFRWMAGSYVFCLRQGWEESGGFDEEFYAAEEIEFSRRLKRWGRTRKQRVRILSESVRTSARKMTLFSHTELTFRALKIIFMPWSLKKREHCDVWYERR